MGESSEEGVAQGLLRRAVIGLPLDEPIVAAKKYFELDAGQIKAAFARHLRLDDFVQVVRGPAPNRIHPNQPRVICPTTDDEVTCPKKDDGCPTFPRFSRDVGYHRANLLTLHPKPDEGYRTGAPRSHERTWAKMAKPNDRSFMNTRAVHRTHDKARKTQAGRL